MATTMPPNVPLRPAGRRYHAAPGARFSDADAERYGTYLERTMGLGQRVVAPEEIVEKARSKRCPLHNYFTWNDTDAAEMWRVEEARHLVRHIVIYADVGDEEERPVRAFHNVVERLPGHETADRGYTAQRRVWSSPALSSQILDRAMRELASWRDRYRTYEFLSRQVGLVSQALEKDDT